MKKLFLITLFGLFSIITNARVIWFQAYEFASADVYNNSYYWSKWEPSSVKGCINTDEEVVTIYSSSVQRYYILEDRGVSYDKDGQTLTFRVANSDNIIGDVKLRIQKNNGARQLYVYFADCAWVYNITTY